MPSTQQDSPQLTIRGIDLNTCRLSLHNALETEANPNRDDFGPADAFYVIDVPLNSASNGEDSPELQLEFRARISQLEGASFRFIPAETCSDNPLGARLEQLLPYLRESFLGDGLLANNFNHFLKILSSSSSCQLQCSLIRCGEPWGVPEEALEKVRFRTLYANLFGGAHLSLGMYAELAEALERINPRLEVSWLDMKLHPSNPPVLLLLGEPDH